MTATVTQLDADLRDLLATVHGVLPDAYLVGGAVRDLLLGRRPADLDFVTSTDAAQAATVIARAFEAHAFPLDPERGVYRLVLRETAAVHEIDVSQASLGLEADLRRRDFTVDALAAPLTADGALGDVVDVCGGLSDLQARRLRMTGRDALRDDPLRLLRAARLATELGLDVEHETAATIRDLAPSLATTSGERQRDELVRILATSRAAGGVRLMDGLGLLDVLLPELAPARGVGQPTNHHYYDVFDHSIETLAALDEMVSAPQDPTAAGILARGQSGKRGLGRLFQSLTGHSSAGDKQVLARLPESPIAGRPERPWLRDYFQRGLAEFELDAYLDQRAGGTSRRVLLKLAGLLHDVSKPETRTVEADGKVRFLGHPELGALKAQRICSRLRFGNREAAFVSKLVEEHLRPTMLSSGDLPTRRALYRFYRDLDEAAAAVLILCLADGAGAAGPRLRPDRWRGHIAYMAYILEHGAAQAEATASRPRLVTGNDLISALGLAPGPLLGRLLEAIAEAHAAGELSTREEALAYAARLMDEWKREEAEQA